PHSVLSDNDLDIYEIPATSPDSITFKSTDGLSEITIRPRATGGFTVDTSDGTRFYDNNGRLIVESPGEVPPPPEPAPAPVAPTPPAGPEVGSTIIGGRTLETVTIDDERYVVFGENVYACGNPLCNEPGALASDSIRNTVLSAIDSHRAAATPPPGSTPPPAGLPSTENEIYQWYKAQGVPESIARARARQVVEGRTASGATGDRYPVREIVDPDGTLSYYVGNDPTIYGSKAEADAMAVILRGGYSDTGYRDSNGNRIFQDSEGDRRGLSDAGLPASIQTGPWEKTEQQGEATITRYFDPPTTPTGSPTERASVDITIGGNTIENVPTDIIGSLNLGGAASILQDGQSWIIKDSSGSEISRLTSNRPSDGVRSWVIDSQDGKTRTTYIPDARPGREGQWIRNSETYVDINGERFIAASESTDPVTGETTRTEFERDGKGRLTGSSQITIDGDGNIRRSGETNRDNRGFYHEDVDHYSQDPRTGQWYRDYSDSRTYSCGVNYAYCTDGLERVWESGTRILYGSPDQDGYPIGIITDENGIDGINLGDGGVKNGILNCPGGSTCITIRGDEVWRQLPGEDAERISTDVDEFEDDCDNSDSVDCDLFNQLDSAYNHHLWGSTIQGIINEFQAWAADRNFGTFIGALFWDDKDKQEWMQTVDDALCATKIFGSVDCYVSEICGEYLEDVPAGGGFISTSSGLIYVAAHIEGQRSQAISFIGTEFELDSYLAGEGDEPPDITAYAIDEEGARTFHLYKFTFVVNNPQDSGYGNLTFNVRLKGESRNLLLYPTYITVGEGKSVSRAGDNPIVQYSKYNYTEICIEFSNRIQVLDDSYSEVCNKIITYDGDPTTYAEEQDTDLTGTNSPASDVNNEVDF
ncbi:hypothetical protein ACFLZX_03415, partial [Nanoarchaeota archaeon]